MAAVKSIRQEVCKICFNSSSHKPNPFLTPESNAVADPKTKKKTCSRCHQEWISISVQKEPAFTSKWVHVRENLQKNVRLCRFIKSGTRLCPNGQSCSFAHNQAEVGKYSTSATPNNRDSVKQRVRTSSGNVAAIRKTPDLSFRIRKYKLCKFYAIQSYRKCIHGEFCTFAHSIEELNEWNKGLANDRGIQYFIY